MKAMNDDDKAARFAAKRLAENLPDVEMRRVYAGLAKVFAEKAGCLDVWNKELEGWQVQRSQVMVEWEAAASKWTTREHVLRVLRVRLRDEVPADLVQRVEAQESQQILTDWLDHAATVSSFDEMRAAMR